MSSPASAVSIRPGRKGFRVEFKEDLTPAQVGTIAGWLHANGGLSDVSAAGNHLWTSMGGWTESNTVLDRLRDYFNPEIPYTAGLSGPHNNVSRYEPNWWMTLGLYGSFDQGQVDGFRDALAQAVTCEKIGVNDPTKYHGWEIVLTHTPRNLTWGDWQSICEALGIAI